MKKIWSARTLRGPGQSLASLTSARRGHSAKGSGRPAPPRKCQRPKPRGTEEPDKPNRRLPEVQHPNTRKPSLQSRPSQKQSQRSRNRHRHSASDTGDPPIWKQQSGSATNCWARCTTLRYCDLRLGFPMLCPSTPRAGAFGAFALKPSAFCLALVTGRL